MLNILPNSQITAYTKLSCCAGQSEMSKEMLCHMPEALVSINTAPRETSLDWQVATIYWKLSQLWEERHQMKKSEKH